MMTSPQFTDPAPMMPDVLAPQVAPRLGAGTHAAPANAQRQQVLSWLDRVGMLLSFACAVHCIVTPLLLVALPFSHELEDGVRVLLVSLGLVALSLGWIRHRSLRPLPWFALGVTSLGLEHSLPEVWQQVTSAAVAGLCFVSAHWLNTRACKH